MGGAVRYSARYPGAVTETAPEPSEPTLPYGVGPWPGGPRSWPDDPRYDRDLLAHGDRRNVVDEYRYWTMDAIVADLAWGGLRGIRSDAG